jgi:hypothetical protein
MGSIQMTDVLFAPPPSKTASTGATARPPFIAASTVPDKKPVILDMGEASREEGFRLNGCR